MIYEKKHVVLYREINEKFSVTFPALAQILGELAGEHSKAVGNGITESLAKKEAWVLLKWKIEVIRFPKYEEEVTIKTWTDKLSPIISVRSFEVFDNDGNVIVIAESKWTLIDIEKRRPKKITDEIIKIYGPEKRRLFEDIREDKINIEDSESIYNYTISRRDIDLNGHVNNAFYVTFAMETIPYDEYIKYNVNNLEVEYKKECVLGDNIICLYKKEDNKHVIEIKNADTSIQNAIIKMW